MLRGCQYREHLALLSDSDVDRKGQQHSLAITSFSASIAQRRILVRTPIIRMPPPHTPLRMVPSACASLSPTTALLCRKVISGGGIRTATPFFQSALHRRPFHRNLPKPSA
ncbi:unnamed protein product [Gongylonema pulchrum]|uniref:Uncharacterized protein n=1 Tax=Gongylonema pulchrum TaxID=637853 RepID=A0A183EYS9_9BILA|nr:unnamed protein product [Gongylonema pulchrum]